MSKDYQTKTIREATVSPGPSPSGGAGGVASVSLKQPLPSGRRPS